MPWPHTQDMRLVCGHTWNTPGGVYPRPRAKDRYVMRLPDRVRLSGSLPTANELAAPVDGASGFVESLRSRAQSGRHPSTQGQAAFSESVSAGVVVPVAPSRSPVVPVFGPLVVGSFVEKVSETRPPDAFFFVPTVCFVVPAVCFAGSRGVLRGSRGVLRGCRGVLRGCRGVLRGCRGVLRGSRGVLRGSRACPSWLPRCPSWLPAVSFVVPAVSPFSSCCVILLLDFGRVAFGLDAGLLQGRVGSVRCHRPGHRVGRAILRQIDRRRRIRRGERHCQCLTLSPSRSAQASNHRRGCSAPARCPPVSPQEHRRQTWSGRRPGTAGTGSAGHTGCSGRSRFLR